MSVLAWGCGATVDKTEGGESALEPSSDVETPDHGYELPRYPTAAPCPSLVETGFVGDDFCIAAPDDDSGFQLHYGPAVYDDPAELAPWIVSPGDELTDCVFRTTPNDSDVFVSTYHARLRPGTHHMIAYTQPEARADSAHPEDCRQGPQFTFLVGATTPVTDIGADPATRAPEDEGLALKIGARSPVAVQMHYVNTSDRPILREGWINAIYTPEDTVGELAGPVTWIGGLGMAVPPRTTEVVSAGGEQCPAWSEPRRIVELVAHAHASTMRISAFVERAESGRRELVYETYDWQDPGFLRFNSVVQNSTPDRRSLTAGGYSGLLTVAPEDRVSWECEVHNEWDDVTLRFKNEAYTGEMCNMFGVYAPAPDSVPWRCFSL